MATTSSVLYPDTPARLQAFLSHMQPEDGSEINPAVSKHFLPLGQFEDYEAYVAEQERVFDEHDVWSRITRVERRVIAKLNHLASCYFLKKEDFMTGAQTHE